MRLPFLSLLEKSCCAQIHGEFAAAGQFTTGRHWTSSGWENSTVSPTRSETDWTLLPHTLITRPCRHPQLLQCTVEVCVCYEALNCLHFTCGHVSYLLKIKNIHWRSVVGLQDSVHTGQYSGEPVVSWQWERPQVLLLFGLLQWAHQRSTKGLTKLFILCWPCVYFICTTALVWNKIISNVSIHLFVCAFRNIAYKIMDGNGKICMNKK